MEKLLQNANYKIYKTKKAFNHISFRILSYSFYVFALAMLAIVSGDFFGDFLDVR